MSGIAVDVGWLMTLEDGSDDLVLQRVQVISALHEYRVPLLLDAEGTISNEYRRNLSASGLARAFVSSRLKSGPILSFSGKVSARQQRDLVKDGFDMDDLAYVGTASRLSGNGVYLTHESKHRTPSRVTVIRKACGVHIVTETELLEAMKRRGRN